MLVHMVEAYEFFPFIGTSGAWEQVDIVSSDTSARHTFIDIVGANPICRDLVERAKGHDLEAAIDLEQRKEAHYGD